MSGQLSSSKTARCSAAHGDRANWRIPSSVISSQCDRLCARNGESITILYSSSTIVEKRKRERERDRGSNTRQMVVVEVEIGKINMWSIRRADRDCVLVQTTFSTGGYWCLNMYIMPHVYNVAEYFSRSTYATNSSSTSNFWIQIIDINDEHYHSLLINKFRPINSLVLALSIIYYDSYLVSIIKLLLLLKNHKYHKCPFIKKVLRTPYSEKQNNHCNYKTWINSTSTIFNGL